MASGVYAQAGKTCSQDPFAIRAAIEQGTVSRLCGAVYQADLDSKRAVQQLQAILAGNPGADDEYEARSSLFNLYMREGKYPRAVFQLDRILAEKPNDAEMLSDESLVRALARFDDLSVSKRKISSIQGQWADGLLHIPISINGLDATYIVDSAAGISSMSQSEATRLGLKTIQSNSRVTDGGGLQTTAVQVTDVADLQVGAIHLHHVRFVILPDTVRPFVRLPENERGIMGLPPLIALQTFRLAQDATLTVEPPPPSGDVVRVNLAFSSDVPVTELRVGSTALSFELDTGAIQTLLYSEFAKRFPEIARGGDSEMHSVTGVGGSRDIPSSVVSDLHLFFGRPVTLRAGTILLSDQNVANAWASGKVGFDLVRQALPMTIDFRRMQITF